MPAPKISDYSDFDYKTEYWVKSNRNYENCCEQHIVQRLLKSIRPTPANLVDIGGGFGRLAPNYLPLVRHAFLVDFALHQLQDANTHFSGQLHCVKANFYYLPFKTGSIDVAITVRTLHHVIDLPSFIKEVARIVRPGGHFIFEIPNQRHWIQILRYMLRRDLRNPFSRAPIKRGETFYNYHPAYVLDLLEATGFVAQRTIGTSYFRLSILKRFVPFEALFAADRLLQSLLSWAWITPSIFVSALKK